jgi:plasmid stabilization system protein ParE
MTRFSFTPDAEFDIDEIATYLQELPKVPALRIGRKLQQAITNITRFPGLGRIDKRLTLVTRTKVLRLVSGKYILFYYVVEQSVRILGVLDTKRDIDNIMRHRLKQP